MKPTSFDTRKHSLVVSKKTRSFPSGKVDVVYERPTNAETMRHRGARNGDNSPRIKGKLQVRANRFEYFTRYGLVTPGESYAAQWYWGAYEETRTPIIPPTDPYSYFDFARTRYNDNAAIQKLYDLLAENKAQMATTFAERQQTIDLVADKLEKVFRAYRDVKRGNPNRAARRLGLKSHRARSKQASGQWLELQYGWMPLVGDIHTMLDFNTPIRNSIFGVGKTNEQLSYSKSLYGIGKFEVNASYRSIVKYGADVHVRDPALAFSQRAGILNPAVVAWELMPFSFVVDWALPIGDYLDNLTATVGLSFTNTYRSHQAIIEVSAKSNINTATQKPALFNGFARETYRNLVAFPSPSLNIKNPISPVHLANALALGRQFRKE